MDIKQIFTDSNGKLSSKRVLGILGVIASMAAAVVCVIMAVFKSAEISPEVVKIIVALFGFSSGLLGVGVFESGK